MRILHVINMGSTCGGAERLVADLVAAQRRAGHVVQVLASDVPGSGAWFADLTWAQPARRTVASRLGGHLRNPAARTALAQAVADLRPDVVHLHTIGLVAPPSLRELRAVPTVLTVHGPELFLRAGDQWGIPPASFRSRLSGTRLRATRRGQLATRLLCGAVGPWWRRQLTVVDLFLAPSRYIADLIEQDFPATRVVPNGLPTLTAVPARRPHLPEPQTESRAGSPSGDRVRPGGDPTAGPRLLFVGRLETAKGPQVLLDALPAILAAHPGTRLRICGRGPVEASLHQRAAELGITGAVDFAGWLDREQVTREMAAADVVVIPSVWPEAFGLTCLEAFAAGTPVVASAVGALPDLVRPGVTGCLVPPGDPAAIAAAVRGLLADPELARRLGSAGQRVGAGYTMDRHEDAVATAYGEAIDRHAARVARPGRAARLARLLPAPLRAMAADSLVRNSAFLLAATVALAGGGFLFWQVAAQLFSTEQIGQAGALVSASTLLANLAMLGMNNGLIRYLDQWPDPARTVNSGAALVGGAALAGSLVFAVAAPAVAPRVADSLGTLEITAFCLLTTAGAVGMLYDNVFIAQRRADRVLVRNVLVVGLRLVLPFALLGLHAFGIFGAYWLAFALASMPYWFALRRMYGRSFGIRFSGTRLRQMFGYSFGTYVATMIMMAPTLVMPIMVAQRLGLQPAAYYYIAALIASVLQFVPVATARSLFAEATHDPGTLRRHLPRVLRLTAVVQVPLLVASIAAGWLLLRVFGVAYTEAYPLLVLLILANALSSVGYIGSTLLLISARTRLLCVLSAGGYAVSLGGAYLLAGYGTAGIGVALLGGELLLAAGYTPIIVGALRAANSDAARTGDVLPSGPRVPAAADRRVRSAARRTLRSARASLVAAGSRWWRRRVTARAGDITVAVAGRSLLILAPHPDDETFGCGALIARARAAGARVTVVVVSDGARSATSARLSPAQIAALRDGELRAACGELGVDPADIVRLEYPDGNLLGHLQQVQASLAGLLPLVRPETLLLPCITDEHDDHRAVHLAALAAVTQAGVDCDILAYPVWTWHAAPWFGGTLAPARLPLQRWALRQALVGRWVRVACGEHLRDKRAAIARYASQTGNPTGEATWSVLPPTFVAAFLGPAEVFLPVPQPAAGQAGPPADRPVPNQRQASSGPQPAGSAPAMLTGR